MKVFDFGSDVRVAILGRSAACTHARWILSKLGVTIVEADGHAALDMPLIAAGSALHDKLPASPLVVRLWDFQCGMTGSGVNACAVSGVSWVIGLPGRSPLYLPANVPEKWCGTLGVSMALSYFVERLTLRTPYARPRTFDVSSAEILRGFADQNFGNHKQIPASWRRNGRISPEHGGIYPQGFFKCRDGYVGVVGRSRQDWASILAALGNPAWATDDLRNPFELARHSERVDPLFTAELEKHTRHELLDLALEFGATFAPVYHRSEIRREQLVRDAFFDADGSPGLPFEMLPHAASTPAAPEPADERRTESMSGPYYPLQGVRVLEFCWVWAGPFLGQFLADLGAEVIKIEWYDRYDVYRTRGIERLRGKVVDTVYREMSPSFHSLNRNKVGFAVNLKSEEGVGLVKRLAAKSDLVIENWSSRTLERLGVGYEALRAANPRLLMLSLSAIGPSSRLEKMRSYGLVTSSLGGAEEAIRADGEFVGSPTFNISDPNAALFGLVGAMAGLIDSRRRGEGAELVVSQLEAVMSLMAETVPPQGLSEGIFETQGGQYLAVSWPGASAPRDLAAWCLARTSDEATRAIEAQGGMASAVISVVDTPQAPVFADLEVRIAAEHPVTGREEVIAAPWRIEGRRAPLRKPAPLMAEGNSYVLRNVLGLAEEEIARLKACGAI